MARKVSAAWVASATLTLDEVWKRLQDPDAPSMMEFRSGRQLFRATYKPTYSYVGDGLQVVALKDVVLLEGGSVRWPCTSLKEFKAMVARGERQDPVLMQSVLDEKAKDLLRKAK